MLFKYKGCYIQITFKMITLLCEKNGWMGNTERRCISSYKMLTQLETGRACLRWVLYHLVHWDRYNLKWRQIKSLEQSMHAKYLNFFLLIYDFFFYTFSFSSFPYYLIQFSHSFCWIFIKVAFRASYKIKFSFSLLTFQASIQPNH